MKRMPAWAGDRLGLTAGANYRIHNGMNDTGGRLDHLGVLAVAGADALSFLQGQLTNDTRRLAAGAPLLAAYCSPQGRVWAVMHLLPRADGALAILPRELVRPVLERLKKFVMRAKVTLDDLSDELAVGGRHAPGGRRSAAPAPFMKDGVLYGPVRPDSSREWLVGVPARLAAMEAGAAGRAASGPDWRLADIREGLPQVYADTSELFVAQMLNLDLIDGIRFSKGCFTGQEIIARTQHLGRIKRRMHRLSLPQGDWHIGQAIVLTDGRSGRLTELADTGDAFEALAVLTGDPGAGGTPVAANELPLPYALTAPT